MRNPLRLAKIKGMELSQGENTRSQGNLKHSNIIKGTKVEIFG